MRLLLRHFRPLLTAAALTLAASNAHAQFEKGYMNLSWDDCGTFGTAQRTFACNTNAGTNTMYASGILEIAMPQLNGAASVLEMQTNQPTLSNWWWIGGNGTSPNCRASTVFTGDFNFLGNINCLDPWAGAAAGGISFTQAFGGVNRARIRVVCGIPGSTSAVPGNEYYFFKVTFSNARSTGAGSCAGCLDGACIVLNSISLFQPAGGGDHSLYYPATRQYVTWQGGSDFQGGCPGATPTRTTTWGSVKSLYR